MNAKITDIRLKLPGWTYKRIYWYLGTDYIFHNKVLKTSLDTNARRNFKSTTGLIWITPNNFRSEYAHFYNNSRWAIDEEIDIRCYLSNGFAHLEHPKSCNLLNCYRYTLLVCWVFRKDNTVSYTRKLNVYYYSI